MNNFELFKLRESGITNNGLLRILNYVKTKSHSSIKDLILVSGTKQPSLIKQRYKDLDFVLLKERFNRFPSFSILDAVYPEELKQIYNPPVLLFYRGDLSLLDQPKLGVVGARDASQIGTLSVQKIISDLKNQFVIVSGLARGIDTAAHVATLKNGGKTIGVIGSGLDVHYPKENQKLQEFIAKHHLLLSEYGPNTEPRRYHFPERNRIIAGLSLGIIVSEAKARSGSLITCERAMEEGRDVFAIPGNILNGNSDGCHRLIQEGAKCIWTGVDVLSEYIS